jgi:hypothetical protein
MTGAGWTQLPIAEHVDSVAERLAGNRQVRAEQGVAHVLGLGSSPAVHIVEHV